MNKFLKLQTVALILIAILSSCGNDDEAPTIDSVWYNMVDVPVEVAPCAYPGQTLCIHGSGFESLRLLIVNGTQIDLNNILVYVADNFITFTVPSDVNTEGDYIRVVTAKGKADYRFIIRPKSEQSTITAFSSTTLIPGNTLTIQGTNLSGAKEVYLPLAFNGTVKCEFDDTKENTDENIYVKIPEANNFATGYCTVVVEKNDEARGITYTEKILSSKTNFIN